MTNANDPAFESPILGERSNGSVYAYSMGGLTTREYFAAMAMQGFANYGADSYTDESVNTIAKKALRLADALIAELNK